MNTKAKGSVSPRKLKDEQLRKAVQGFKLVNLICNHAEIAMVAEVSKGTVHNKSKMIEELWSKDSNTPNDDKRFILERGIELGIKEIVGSESPTLEQIFGVIIGMHLKVETDALDNVDTIKSVWTIGRHITNIYKIICSYKDENGALVHSELKSAKYLRQTIDLDKLFIRSDSYLPSRYSKRWLANDTLRNFVELSLNEFLDGFIKNPAALTSIFPSFHMSSSDDTKKGFFTISYDNIYTIIKVDINILRQFEIRSVFNILMRMTKIIGNEIQIPAKHESSKADEFYGRSYNVFCSLRSIERKKLGYIGYDMSAAMQSICLQLIKATNEDYPMLWNYAHDKMYKKRIRAEIAQDLGIDIDEVKSKLTAFANGSTTEKKRHPYYKAFQEESNRLRKAVLKYANDNEPKILERAIEQSSRELPETVDWSDVERKETRAEMLSSSSVFFFVWTWYERQIRQAMIDALDGGIEVHDAVYSKKDIDTKIVEKEIYDQTRFRITIEKE